jgi:L-lysine exporter family protein LysE/ArgO
VFLMLVKGFTAGGGLIVSIGAQNAFVIKQGIMRRHLFLTALFCSLIDAVLILLGVFGFGRVISEYPLLINVSKYFAVIFLFLYGAYSLRSAFKGKNLEVAKDEIMQSRKKTVLLLLVFTLFNPNVYLETVILLGSIASQEPYKEQGYFAAGAIAASFVWFFSITYGSRLLAPYLSKPKAWKIIDTTVAFVMWGIAITLLITL